MQRQHTVGKVRRDAAGVDLLADAERAVVVPHAIFLRQVSLSFALPKMDLGTDRQLSVFVTDVDLVPLAPGISATSSSSSRCSTMSTFGR